MLKEGSTVFGPKGDCQPPNFSIRKEHCTVERSGSSVSITPGKGETFVNGKFLTAKMNLKKGDRVCMASEVMLLVFPGEEMEEMEPEAMFEELQNAIEARAAAGGGGGGGGADDAALKARIAELEQKLKDLAEPGSDPAAGAATLNEQEIKELYKKSRECKELCKVRSARFGRFCAPLSLTGGSSRHTRNWTATSSSSSRRSSARRMGTSRRSSKCGTRRPRTRKS